MSGGQGYPSLIVPVDHIEPVPRRIRAFLGGVPILDTTRAIYLWEIQPYPQYYVPVADIAADALADEQHEQKLHRGTARRHGLRAGGVERPGTVRVFGADALAGLDGYARIDWAAPDAWFEEDEQVYVHPRSPYTHLDALRSTRTVRVEHEGVVLAESSAPVMVFETGLPTRYYLDRTAVRFDRLEPSDTATACPYKGVTSAYWSLPSGPRDIAWAYDFPTRQLQPITGLVCFYNEKIDTLVDGDLLERPVTHFS